MANSQTPEPQTEIIDRLVRRQHWTRRRVSPWTRRQLGSQTAPAQSAGFVRAWRPLFRARQFLTQIQHRPEIARTLHERLTPLLPARMAGMAGAIAQRLQGLQMARPLLRRVEAEISQDELVLASGMPATAPVGDSPPAAQFLPQMLAERGIVPPGGGFSVGQAIPPMPPKSGEAGFSVGQRIPPMPRKDKPADKLATPAKKTPAKKVAKPTPAPGQRIFSRVEEILPGQPAPAVGEPVREPEPGEDELSSLPETEEAVLSPAAPETGAKDSGGTPDVSAASSTTAPTVQRQVDSSQTAPSAAPSSLSAAEGVESPPPQRVIADRPIGETGEIQPPPVAITPQEAIPDAPVVDTPLAESVPEQVAVQRKPVPGETEPEPALPDTQAAAPAPPPQPETPPPVIRPKPDKAPPAEAGPPARIEPVSSPPAPAALEVEVPSGPVQEDVSPDRDLSGQRTAGPVVEVDFPETVRDFPEPAAETTAPAEIDVEADPEVVAGETAVDKEERLPPPGQLADSPADSPQVRPLPRTSADQTPAAIVKPLAPETPPEETTGPPIPPQAVPSGERPGPEAASRSVEGPEESLAPAAPDVLPPAILEPGKPSVQRAKKPQVPEETVGRPPAARRPAVTGEQETLGAVAPGDKAPQDAAAESQQDTGTAPAKPSAPTGDGLDLTLKRPPAMPTPPASAAEGTAGVQRDAVAGHETGPAEAAVPPEPPARPSDLSRRLAARRSPAISQPQPAAQSLPARLALATSRIRQRQQAGIGPLRRQSQVFDRASGRQLPGPLPLHSPAAKGEVAGGVKPTETSRKSAFEAFERRFGLPPEMKPPQASNVSLLAGLAQLGQPKYVPAGRLETPDPVAPGLSSEPGRPFSLADITLGQPKITVVRRQPSASKADSAVATPVVEPGRKAVGPISAGRSPLELVRRATAEGTSPTSATSSDSELIEEISTSGDEVKTPDFGALARDVYPIIKRLLALERERLG